MATFYVDPAGSNTAPYDTWVKAATSLQTAADTAVAGDIVYCRGTQTTAAAIDFDTNAGTNTVGWIKFIGCNAAGNVDGTRFILDADGGSYNAIGFTATAKMVWMENIEAKNTGAGTYHGFASTTWESAGCVFINCCANNVSGGFVGTNFTFALYYRCVAYSCRAIGFAVQPASRLISCVSRDNADDGFSGGAQFYGCVSHGNTQEGFGGLPSTALLLNCVCDGNGDDGVELASSTTLYGLVIFGTRVTNQPAAGSNGLITVDEPCIIGHCYFEDNDDNIAGASHDAAPNATFQFLPLEGGTTTSLLEDGADTNEGYVDKTNHDFSTNYVDGDDPSLRRRAITLPWS